MPEWVDYYAVLGTAQDTSQDGLTRAYRGLARELHPDRLGGVPEVQRRTAEERLKLVNAAYHVLREPERRERYDAEWRQRLAPPQPTVDTPSFKFSFIGAGESRAGSFIVRNIGGPYKSVKITDPGSWLRITGYEPLTPGEQLPLRVLFEVQGDAWGVSYSDTVVVRLDDQEAKVRISLHTTPNPQDNSRKPLTPVPATPATPSVAILDRSSTVRKQFKSRQSTGASSLEGLSRGIWIGAIVGGVGTAITAAFLTIIGYWGATGAIAMFISATTLFLGIAGALIGAVVGALIGVLVGLARGSRKG